MDQVNLDGKTPDGIVICGDYTNDAVLHDYQLRPDESIQEIKEIVESRCANVDEDTMMFVQGNHVMLSDSISKTGIHEFENYYIYVINTQNDFPWKQGTEPDCYDKVKATASELNKCLNGLIQKGENKRGIVNMCG